MFGTIRFKKQFKILLFQKNKQDNSCLKMTQANIFAIINSLDRTT